MFQISTESVEINELLIEKETNRMQRRLTKQRDLMRMKRENEEFRKQERIQGKLSKRERRKDPQFVEKERKRVREYKRIQRANEFYKQQERLRDKLYKRNRRKNDPEYLEKYRIRDRLYRRSLRSNPEYMEKLRVREREYKRRKRENLKNQQNIELQQDAIHPNLQDQDSIPNSGFVPEQNMVFIRGEPSVYIKEEMLNEDEEIY